MSAVGQSERATQNRVIALFQKELGYRYRGSWAHRDTNNNVEEPIPRTDVTRSGCSPAQINRAIYLLRAEADNPTRGLYGNNQAVYSLLRYGVDVKTGAGKSVETVQLVN